MRKQRTLSFPLFLVIALSFLESILIIAGMLPPIFSYSPGNLLFALATAAVIIHTSVSRADETLKESLINGATLGFTTASIICASGLIGKEYFAKPVLGISAPTPESRFAMLLLIILENTFLSAILSATAAWLTKRLRRPSPQ